MPTASASPRGNDDDRLANTDPEVALRAVRSLRKLAEYLEQVHVQHARELGWSWQEIASPLGVTRQTVHKKHGDAGGSK